MPNNIDNRPCLHKRATVLKYKNGVATVRVHTDGDGCPSCAENKQNSCALYSFGAIFSRNRNVWRIPSKRAFKHGEQIQLSIRADTLLKIAASCYGLPIVILAFSTTLTHLLGGIEWLTVLVATGSLIASYLLAKRGFRFIRISDIKLTR